MVIKQGSISIYENCSIKVAQELQGEHRVALVFREMDFDGTPMEAFAPAHVFHLTTDELDALVDAFMEKRSAKIHLPTNADVKAVQN